MMEMYRLRLAVYYPANFYSHRDEARIIERALRRAGSLPVYTSGFSPHPKISFGPARPTGYASLCDYLDVQLQGEINKERVNSCLPPGLELLEANRIVETEYGKLNRRIKAALQAVVVRRPSAEIADMLASLPDTTIYNNDQVETSILKFISDKMQQGELIGGLSCYCCLTELAENRAIPRIDRLFLEKFSEQELTLLNPVFLRVCYTDEAKNADACSYRGNRKDTHLDR